MSNQIVRLVGTFTGSERNELLFHYPESGEWKRSEQTLEEEKLEGYIQEKLLTVLYREHITRLVNEGAEENECSRHSERFYDCVGSKRV